MKTLALIEKGKDGTFGIYTPNIDHTIIGDGETVSDAKADFENSVNETIASYLEQGEYLPNELQNIEFEYKYDIASLFNYYSWINVSKIAHAIGINPSLMRQYKGGDTYISEEQVRKIENGLRTLGKEMAKVKLT